MYDITYTDSALKFISKIPKKDKTHVKEAIELCLGKYLKRVTKHCNKKLMKGSKLKIHRLHISMTYTLFYQIDDENKRVTVVEAMGINQAHSKYGLF
jgi:mRNA-degrading endonuclease RelE of RelBE toxin-antitoxin system